MKVNFHIKQNVLISDFGATNTKPRKSGEKVEQTFPQNSGQCFTRLPSAVFLFINFLTYPPSPPQHSDLWWAPDTSYLIEEECER